MDIYDGLIDGMLYKHDPDAEKKYKYMNDEGLVAAFEKYGDGFCLAFGAMMYFFLSRLYHHTAKHHEYKESVLDATSKAVKEIRRGGAEIFASYLDEDIADIMFTLVILHDYNCKHPDMQVSPIECMDRFAKLEDPDTIQRIFEDSDHKMPSRGFLVEECDRFNNICASVSQKKAIRAAVASYRKDWRI